jgi:peptidoglycan LD-endopeptidase LytH
VGAAAAVLLATAAPAAARAATPRSPIADAQAGVALARRAADVVAARYSAALSESAQMDARVAELERLIPADEARGAALHDLVRRRAALLYKGNDPGSVMALLDSPDIVTTNRKAFLARVVQRHDHVAAERLRKAVDAARDERAELRSKQAAQAELTARLADEQRQLDHLLEASAAALRELEALATRSAVAVDGLICPVDGPVAFTDDFGQPRPENRHHEGNDIFAARGTRNVALVAGTIIQQTAGNGGNAVWLAGDDGNNYYYAHLDHFEGGPRRVAQGDLIGYTGDTGNATGGASHTHFELHPHGGGPVDPYATLRAICG